MKKLILSFICITGLVILLPLLLQGKDSGIDPDLEIIRDRVIAELMEPEVDNDNIKHLTGTIRDDGTWLDGDLIRIASIFGKRGLYLRDPDIFGEAVQAMVDDIAFAVERRDPDDIGGLQTDFSFYHRSDRVLEVYTPDGKEEKITVKLSGN